MLRFTWCINFQCLFLPFLVYFYCIFRFRAPSSRVSRGALAALLLLSRFVICASYPIQTKKPIVCVVPSQPSGEHGHPLVPQLAAANSPALSEREADLCPTETFSSPAGLQATDLVFSGMRAECNIDCNAYCSYLLHSLARKR